MLPPASDGRALRAAVPLQARGDAVLRRSACGGEGFIGLVGGGYSCHSRWITINGCCATVTAVATVVTAVAIGVTALPGAVTALSGAVTEFAISVTAVE